MSGVSSTIRQIHLYTGLSLGLLFALTGLTGSFLVFYPQLDDWATPAVRAAASNARPASYEVLYQTLLRTHPERPVHWRIEIPQDGGPLQARSLSAADMAGEQFAPLIVWVDPRDNRILRDVQWGKFVPTWIYDFHYRLLLGPTGSIVMGVVGLLVLGLLTTGVWVWWPSTRRALSRAFSFQRDAPTARQLYDVHKLMGVFAALFLVVIAATGVMISVPGLVRPLLSTLSDPYTAPRLASAPAPDVTRMSVDRALAIASTQLHGGTLKWIDTPRGPADVYAFRYRMPGEPAIRFPNSVVWIDQYSGRIAGLRDATRDPTASIVVDWEHPLHTGEALGLPGKWLAAFLGLIPAALFVTGVWRWLLRRRRAA